jgi:predicted nucleotidyltransferase
VSLSSAQKEVARLTDARILLRTRRGRQTFYRANTRSPLFPELRAILLKTVGLVDLLRGVLADPRIKLALVYGSMASGEEREGSDADVLVVGEVGPREISDHLGDVEREIGREINAVVLTSDEYRKRMHGDHFIQGVMAGPRLYVIGDDDEAERLAQ